MSEGSLQRLPETHHLRSISSVGIIRLGMQNLLLYLQDLKKRWTKYSVVMTSRKMLLLQRRSLRFAERNHSETLIIIEVHVNFMNPTSIQPPTKSTDSTWKSILFWAIWCTMCHIGQWCSSQDLHATIKRGRSWGNYNRGSTMTERAKNCTSSGKPLTEVGSTAFPCPNCGFSIGLSLIHIWRCRRRG